MLELARFAAERRTRTAALVTASVGALAALTVAVADPGTIAALDRLLADLPPGLAAVVAGGLPGVATEHAFVAAVLYRVVWLGGLGAVVATVAAGIVAGKAQGGTLDLTLAQPVTRRRLAAEGFLGVVPLIVLADIATFVVVSLGLFGVGASVPIARLAWLHLLGFVYLLAAAGIGLVASVAIRQLHRARAFAAGTVVWLLLVDGLSSTTDVAWLGSVAPSRYVDPGLVLVEGSVDLGGAVMVAAMAVAAVPVAAWILERRDL